jgi:cell volume regulation protein A
VLQAPTLPTVARALRLRGDEPVDLEVESSPLGALGAQVLQVSVGPTSRLHGVRLAELRLPPDANVTLVVRDGHGTVPDANTVLRHGDELLVVVTSAARLATERRIRAVSSQGRLAEWRAGGVPRVTGR